MEAVQRLHQTGVWTWFERGIARLVVAAAIALMITGVASLVYFTGGIKYVYSHAMYVPIVVAGLAFGARAGLIAGVAGGLALGPFMPIDTTTGEMQDTINWLYRTFFFCLIGVLTGFAATMLREQVKRIRWISEHSADTGLPNKKFLERSLQEELSEKALSPAFAVVVVNVDNYLEIVNTLGPSCTRPLMIAIHERISEVLPSGSLLCLYHSDRFVGVTRNENVDRMLNTLTSTLRHSFPITNIRVYVDTSIGIAHFPLHGQEPHELIQKASIAMHVSLRKGSLFSVYDTRSDQTNRDTLALLGSIPGAIAANEFRLYCQPKLRLADRVCCGAEMLMRWKHPELGEVPPGRFIPHAERTSLIHLLTRWTIEESFKHLEAWVERIPDIHVAINLTARDLGNPELPELIRRFAQQYGIEPGNVELEITESGVMSDQESAVDLLNVIKSYGFRIAIDDFGIGQSSLEYLKNLPVDTLKIDRAFVRNMLTDERDQSIVKTIIAMARSLELEVTAEGIEDEAAIAFLAMHGCTHGQGYAIARPFPAEQLIDWIREAAPRHRA